MFLCQHNSQKTVKAVATFLVVIYSIFCHQVVVSLLAAPMNAVLNIFTLSVKRKSLDFLSIIVILSDGKTG